MAEDKARRARSAPVAGEKQKRGGARVTMHEIAKKARVSLGTVSHVINETAAVREPLRRRVLDTIRDLGYQPNELSRGLRRNRTNMIGMIIPDITNPFFPGVVRGVEDVAYKNSYRLILCNTDNDPGKEATYLGDLKSFLPAGILIIPSVDSTVAPNASGPPMVCIDRRPPGWKGDVVTVANEEGAYEAAQHLLSMGHRQIGVIGGPSHLTNAQERLKGFIKGLSDAKVTIAPEYVQEASFDRTSGYASAMWLLHLLPRPTAIFAANDLMAMGALSAIRESKLSCPGDVSIISFDGLDMTELTDPALTSVYQPGYQMGFTAARLLLERIEGMSGPPQHIILNAELRVRNSVARISIPPAPARIAIR